MARDNNRDRVVVERGDRKERDTEREEEAGLGSKGLVDGEKCMKVRSDTQGNTCKYNN
jgi:hypothetical protein